MKVYRLIWSDLSEGIVIRYARTKREAQKLGGEWSRRYPLRTLLSFEPIDIPGVRSTDKTAFVQWLNNQRRSNA